MRTIIYKSFIEYVLKYERQKIFICSTIPDTYRYVCKFNFLRKIITVSDTDTSINIVTRIF